MARSGWVLAAVLISLTACGGKSTPVACRSDADCAGGSCIAGQCQVPLTVEIVQPAAAVTATRDVVLVEVRISGGQATSVDLLRDGVKLATIAAPYTFSWNTSTESEGSHELRAHVTAGSNGYDSAPKTVIVDRTPPAPPVVNPPAPAASVAHVTGTAEPSAIVTVTYGAGQSATTTATAGGSWAVDLTLAAGTYSLTATATDAAGNVSSPSPPASLSVDPNRPAIVARQPPPGTTDYDVQRPITVTFSKPVAAASVTATSVTLASGGSPIAIDRRLSADRMTLTLAPLAPLAVPANLTAQVTSAVQDDAGNGLLVPADTWSFTAPAWLPVGTASPIVVSAGADTSVNGLAIDPQGNLFLAATETPAVGGTGKVHVLRFDGTAWSPLGGALNVDASQSASDASIALGGDGQPVVVWLEFSPTPSLHQNVNAKRWTGSAWAALGGPLNVGPTTATPAGAGIAVDGSGNVLVGWNEYPNGPDPASAYVKRWNGSGWGLLGGAALSTTSFGYGNVTVAASGSTVYAAFQEGSTAPPGLASFVRVRAFTGAVWQDVGGAPKIETLAMSESRPAITLAGTTPVLTFSESTSTSTWVRATRWSGSAWQSFGSPLNRDTSQGGYYPSIAIAGGEPVVAWMEYPHPKVVHVSTWSGSAWTPLGASLGFGGDAYQPFVVIGPRAAPIVAWTESDATGASSTYVRRFNQ